MMATRSQVVRGCCAAALAPLMLVFLGMLISCSSPPPAGSDTPTAMEEPAAAPPAQPPPLAPSAERSDNDQDSDQDSPAIGPADPIWQADDSAPLPPSKRLAAALWQPARWRELPGWGRDALHEAWNAWLRSCERPAPVWAAVCAELRPLSLADEAQRYTWMMRRLQPYRVLALNGGNQPGLLTGYFEPELSASRVRQGVYRVPLYAPPPTLAAAPERPWFSRQQIDSDAQAQAQLAGRALAWLADPLDALLLQIQGSGRLRITEPDGRVSLVRLAYAGHNGHPYQSVGRWLLQQREIREGTWEAIRAWAAANPHRIDELLWRNPRVVFFREEPLSAWDAQFGPRGAQGVALTPMRSVAVDPKAIPYGTPLWLVSSGPAAQLQRLVLAQDTGSAIVGAVRADFFTGWGDDASALAAGLKQPLQLWALWPREVPLPHAVHH